MRRTATNRPIINTRRYITGAARPSTAVPPAALSVHHRQPHPQRLTFILVPARRHERRWLGPTWRRANFDPATVWRIEIHRCRGAPSGKREAPSRSASGCAQGLYPVQSQHADRSCRACVPEPAMVCAAEAGTVRAGAAYNLLVSADDPGAVPRAFQSSSGRNQSHFDLVDA